MRTKRSILNSFTSTIYYLITFLIGIFVRKATLLNFDNQILGYVGTIESIFTWLQLADMGIGSIIMYRLYKVVAEKDEDQIRMLMSCYRLIYRLVGAFIIFAGIIVVPILHIVFVEDKINWTQIYVLYIILLGSTVSTYFLAFRRALYTANQQAYRCERVDIITATTSSVLKMLVATFYPVYWLFYLLPLLSSVVGNLIISAQYKRDFPQIYSVKVTLKDIKNLHIEKDTGPYLVQRIANAVYNSVDNIVIARFMGALTVTGVSNYSMIALRIDQLSRMLVGGAAASVGNIIYDASVDKKRQQSVFWGLYRFELYVSTVVLVCLVGIFQHFIEVWAGKQYLLSISYVYLSGINIFFTIMRSGLSNYRTPLGNFHLDTWAWVSAALLNAIGSFIAAPFFGLMGIQLCTVVSTLLMIAGILYVVEKLFYPGCYLKCIGYLAICWLYGSFQCIVLNNITSRIPVSFAGLLLCMIIVGATASIFNLPVLLLGKDAAFVREKLKMFLKR